MQFYNRIMHLKGADGMANSVDPDQKEQSDQGLHCLHGQVCLSSRSSLIGVYTVCTGRFVCKLRIITVVLQYEAQL